MLPHRLLLESTVEFLSLPHPLLHPLGNIAVVGVVSPLLLHHLLHPLLTTLGSYPSQPHHWQSMGLWQYFPRTIVPFFKGPWLSILAYSQDPGITGHPLNGTSTALALAVCGKA